MGGHVLITGGAGFIGSYLCERFLREGYDVTAVDNLLTGSRRNLEHLGAYPGFRLALGDVTQPLAIERRVDLILHFASPASPTDYHAHPIHTMKVDSFGAFYARAGQGAWGPLRAGVDLGSLRGSAGASPARGVLGEREPAGAAERVR